MNNKYLIKLKDGGLINYEDDSTYFAGCPTCDYGSEYINDITLTFSKIRVLYSVSRMYSYAVSTGYIMKILLNNMNSFSNMTEEDFKEWFYKKLEECDTRTKDFRNLDDFKITMYESKIGSWEP